MVGNQIGDFRIIEKLGEGGMGVVYKAVDVRLDRPVAIKMLTADLAHNPELEQRFQAEARAQANLNHTNLATLYAFLVDQGNAYMVMEFVEGENFDQIIRRSGPMNPRDAIPWFKQALLGIGAAHRVGIIHRDIKPSNLMLNRQGIVKVMDFGIAKAVGTRGMTRTGVHLGTLAYMSPEQIQGRTVDVRSDIYALGITLYEMLSGHVPFESESDFQTMHDHVSTLPPPLTRLYPYASVEIPGVVAKALSKNPDDRFQTVEEFGVALEHPENVAVAIPPVYAPPPAMVRGTVVESVTGPGQWQGAGGRRSSTSGGWSGDGRRHRPMAGNQDRFCGACGVVWFGAYGGRFGACGYHQRHGPAEETFASCWKDDRGRSRDCGCHCAGYRSVAGQNTRTRAIGWRRGGRRAGEAESWRIGICSQ